jgi:hypothetical protein
MQPPNGDHRDGKEGDRKGSRRNWYVFFFLKSFFIDGISTGKEMVSEFGSIQVQVVQVGDT